MPESDTPWAAGQANENEFGHIIKNAPEDKHTHNEGEPKRIRQIRNIWTKIAIKYNTNTHTLKAKRKTNIRTIRANPDDKNKLEHMNKQVQNKIQIQAQ